jgi:DNA invertase Pin-like site-specific DNA recombinase
MRDLVAAGSASAVLAQDHDRFAREPAYLSFLRESFGQHGCKLRALNDRGDDSPEGQLTDSILDQIARFERLKIAEGTRRGKRSSKSRTISLSHVVKGMGNDAQRKIRSAQSPQN